MEVASLLEEKASLTYEKYLLLPSRYELYCVNVLHSCSGHGSCLLEKCFCQPGWTGLTCEKEHEAAKVEPCEPMVCELAGTKYLCSNLDPSDACHYNPDFGVLQVTRDRWSTAQDTELLFWKGNNSTEDRNGEHLFHFNYYKTLREVGHIHLGNILEFAAGPYTQTKSLLLQMTNGTFNSITLLEPQLMEYKANVSGCSYKDNKLFGIYPVNFLVGRAEDFVFSEVYDTVIMINAIEHCQDGVAVLNNLYKSIKPGGILIWHERAFPLYQGKPYVYSPHAVDFIFHPLRLKQSFWEWFVLEHFEPLYYKVEEDVSLQPSQTMLYFIGRKPLKDKGVEYILGQ